MPMARGRNGPMPPAGGGRIDALPDEHILGFLATGRRGRADSATSLRIRHVGDHVKDLWEFVYHLLLLRRGAPLKVCDFYFPGFDDQDVPRVNLWFRYAVACNVRFLRLPSDGRGRLLELDDLPLVSHHLRILDLQFVRAVHPCNVYGLSSLKSHLQRLWFEFSEISSESLEHLSIVDSKFSDRSEGRSRTRIRICTPNLLSLRLRRLQGKTPMHACWRHAILAECLELTSVRSMGYGHKIEMKGTFSLMERSSAISEHLEEVKIKCDVVDERILGILKFLCTFNILCIGRLENFTLLELMMQKSLLDIW
ncbi:hypothetical protein EJB05_36923, partial [Eragrostis curvula]